MDSFQRSINRNNIIRPDAWTTISYHGLFSVWSMVCLLMGSSHISAQTNETFAAGAYIVDMGQLPQTNENAIVPYGMVYDLLEDYDVDVKWIINPTKMKDGVDFTYNGYDYRGGPFIIPAEYMSTTVLDRIQNYWELEGVVGTITTSPITVPVFTTITEMPIWTLDDANGGIAQGYLENALIPESSYNFEDPQYLDCCDDLFAMPHADPVWESHSNLIHWNLDCKGEIWMACHAGSAFLNMFDNLDTGEGDFVDPDPVDPNEQTNMLVSKTGPAMGDGPWADPANAAILWGDHGKGTPPYSYQYPSNPVMQFMGIIDPATQNGSEQIYIPVDGAVWNPGAVMVYDPDHPDASGAAVNQTAAVAVYDYAFGDTLRGRVMLEAGHSHNKGGTESVAAMRMFFNFSFFSFNENVVVPDLSHNPSELLGGDSTLMSFILPGDAKANDYTILWTSSCGGTFVPNDDSLVTYIPPIVSGDTPCILYASITDGCGRESKGNVVVVIRCDLGLTYSIDGLECFGDTDAELSFNAATGVPPFTWSWDRTEGGSDNGTGTLISGLSFGTYAITVTDNNGAGCPYSFTTYVAQPQELSTSAVASDVVCNGDASGAIDLTVTGGTPSYLYDWGGGITTEDRSNISGGSYKVTVTDNNSCTDTLTVIVGQPSEISIDTTLVHVACYGESTGSITLSVSGGAGGYTYAWGDGPSTQNRSSLVTGTYDVTVTDADNCTNSLSIPIGQPALVLSLSATSSDVDCSGGSDGSIDLTVSGGTIGSGYSYNWSNAETTEDISGLSAGTFTVTVTDANSCTAVLSKTISIPSALSLSAAVTNATCPTDLDGAIDITVAGGTPTYIFDWSDLTPVEPEDRTSLAPGTYALTVTDQNGCTATLSSVVGANNPSANPPTSINH